MRILEIAKPALVLDYNHSITHAIGQMLLRKGSDAVIVKDGKYHGMLFANDLIRRSLVNPDKIKVGKFALRIPLFPSSTDVHYCINSMLVHDFISIPLSEKNQFLVLTKLSILKCFKQHEKFKRRKASDIMKIPITIDSEKPIAFAIKLFLEKRISRLIVTKNDRIDGLLEGLHILSTLIRKEKPKELLTEKKRPMTIPIDSFYERNIPIARSTASISDIIQVMAKSSSNTAIISDDGYTPIGIVTPKTILSLLVERPSGVKISLSGLEGDAEARDVIEKYAVSFSRKLGRISEIDYISIHIKKHQKEGGKAKYSLKGLISCKLGLFHSSSYSWSLQDAVATFFEVFEREIIREKGKQRR